jgi:hypothetical protein
MTITGVESIDSLRIHAILSITLSQYPEAKRALDRILARLNDMPDMPGVCRYCGCQEERPCGVLQVNGLAATCGWINEERTVCSSLTCLSLYEAESGVRMEVQTSALVLP